MLVIRAVAVHVSGTVDQPADVEGDGVPEDGGKEVGIPQTLTPEVPRHEGRDHKAHQHNRTLVVPVGKEKDTITVVGTTAGVKWGWISGDMALPETPGTTWAGPITGAAGNISDIHNHDIIFPSAIQNAKTTRNPKAAGNTGAEQLRPSLKANLPS